MSEVAGRIEIEVGSDTSGFAPALKQKLEAIVKGIVAKVQVEADTDNLKESIEAKVKEAAKGVTAKVGVEVKKGTEAKLRASIESVVQAASAGITAKVGVEVDKKTASEMRRALDGSRGKAIEVPARVDRKGLLRSWLDARAAVDRDARRKPIDLPFTPRSFRSAFMPVIYASIASLLQPLVAVIGGTLGGLAAMVGNLAAATKTVAVLPAILAGALGSMSAIKAITGSLSGDLAPLTGDLKTVKRELDDIGDQLKEARVEAGKRFWKVMADEVKPLAEVLLPLYTKSLNMNSDALARSAKRAAEWIKSPGFTRQSNALIADGAKLTESFTTALIGWAKGALNVANAASPMVERLSQFIKRTGEWAAGIGDTKDESTALAEQFKYAGDKAAQLWRMTKDIGKSIANIFSAGRESGDSLLKSLEDNLQKFRDWTGSVEGQNRIKQWFKDIEPIARSVGSLVVELAKSLARMAADPNVAKMVDGIRQDLLPVLEKFLTTMGKTVGPQVIELIEKVLTALSEMSTAGGPIATGLGYVNSALGVLTDLLKDYPIVAKGLGIILGGLLAYRALAFMATMTGVTTLFSGLRNALGGGALAASMTGFGLAVGGMTGAFSGLPGPMNGVATALGIFLALQPMVPAMSSALSGIATSIGNFRTQVSAGGGLTRTIGTTAKTGIRGALGGLATALGIGAAGGPAGMLIAGGLAAVSAAVGIWAQSHADAKEKAQAYKGLVDDITASLKAESGALTEATELRVIDSLERNGALKAAREYGVSLETLKDAALGSVPAQRSLNQQLGDSALKMALARDKTGTLQKAMSDANISQRDFADAIMEGGSALDPYIQKMRNAAAGDEAMLAMIDLLIPGLRDAADGHRVVADKAGASAAAMRDAAGAWDRAAEAQGKSRKQVEGVIGQLAKVPKNTPVKVEALTKDAVKKLQELGYKVEEMPDGSFQITTNTTKPTQQIAGVIAKLGKVPKDTPVKVRALTADAVKMLERLGYKVTHMPDGSTTVTARASTARAESALNYAARLRRAEIQAVYTGGGGRADGAILEKVVAFAKGGIKVFADGGVERAMRTYQQRFAGGGENHVAQIATAGSYRVWGESETGGEAYIPFHLSKRNRSLAILAEVAKRFGLALAPRLEGMDRVANGLARALPAQASPTAVAKRGGGFNQGPRITQKFGPGSISVTNPVPEPASKSIADNLRGVSEFGILEGDDD